MFVPYIGEDKLKYFGKMLLKKLPKIWRDKIRQTGDKMRGFSIIKDKEAIALESAFAMKFFRDNIENKKHLIIAILIIVIKRYTYDLEFPDCAFNEILQLTNQIEDKSDKEMLYHYLCFVAASTEQHDWSDMISIKYLRNHAVASVNSSSDSWLA